MVLTRAGAAAWVIERIGATTGRSVAVEVHVFESGGERTVDSGQGIAPRSLALGGATIYWTNDGQPRSLELRRRRAARRPAPG